MRALVALSMLALVACDWPPAAKASHRSAVVEVARAAPALSNPLGLPNSFTVDCTVDAVRIEATGGMNAYRCFNSTSTAVYVGDEDDVHSAGIPYCTSSSCDGAGFGADAKFEYCAMADGGSGTDAGSIELRCRGFR